MSRGLNDLQRDASARNLISLGDEAVGLRRIVDADAEEPCHSRCGLENRKLSLMHHDIRAQCVLDVLQGPDMVHVGVGADHCLHVHTHLLYFLQDLLSFSPGIDHHRFLRDLVAHDKAVGHEFRNHHRMHYHIPSRRQVLGTFNHLSLEGRSIDTSIVYPAELVNVHRLLKVPGHISARSQGRRKRMDKVLFPFFR